MRVSLISLLLLAAACGPKEVVMKGTVFDSPGDSAAPFSGAKISIFDEDENKYDNAKANASGKFEAVAPEGAYIHAEISGDGFETTSFTGPSGLSDVFRVEDGTLYGLSSDERAEWEARFAGCPDLDEPGGVIFGEIRMLELTENGEHPLVNGVAEVVTQNQKTLWRACYLDEDGIAFDADATSTGVLGAFAIFGIEPGTHILTVGWEFAPDVWSYSDTWVRVIDGGVAPRFPAWVEWPDV